MTASWTAVSEGDDRGGERKKKGRMEDREMGAGKQERDRPGEKGKGRRVGGLVLLSCLSCRPHDTTPRAGKATKGYSHRLPLWCMRATRSFGVLWLLSYFSVSVACPS